MTINQQDGAMNADQEKFADKIAKLLRKAEDPKATAAEAEAFVSKAQALMTQYAISEELLNRARGVNKQEAEKIVQDEIVFTGIFHQALFDIGSQIARNNECRILISRKQKSTGLIIIGTESDVAATKMLNASVQIQAVGALGKWWKTQDAGWMTPSQKYKERRQFLFSFASGLGSKLAMARREGEQAAAEAEAERVGGNVGDAKDCVALVIKGKEERVNDWVDQTYGKLRKGVSRNYAAGGYGARQAGADAGRRANLGGAAVAGGNAGALNR